MSLVDAVPLWLYQTVLFTCLAWAVVRLCFLITDWGADDENGRW